MGTISTLVRNLMLDASSGTGTGLNYIELVNSEGHDFGRHALNWQDAVNGEKVQDGTVTIVEDLPEVQEEFMTITGFNFFNDDSTSTPSGDGSFQDPVTLEYGNEYTINISGITITLPE